MKRSEEINNTNYDKDITREYIEQLNDIEPYCFDTDREEWWFNIGLKYGLEAADANPKSPWISVEEDLPCNYKELIDREIPTYTHFVVVRLKDGTVASARMIKIPDGNWVWPFNVSHWFPIPKLPKE